MMLAKMLRGRQALQQANNNAYQLQDVAAVTQMANNEGAANAAKAAFDSDVKRYKPVQMGNQGFMLGESGDFVESPVYTEQKQLDRAERLRLAREAEAARKQMLADTLANRAQIAGESNATRLLIAAMMQQNKGAKDEEKKNAQTDKDVQKLAAFADKKQLPRLLPQARQLLDAIEKAGTQDVPGLSTTDQVALRIPFGDRMLSQEAKDNQAAYQGILNALTRADAGLSQTKGEVLRQQLEVFSSPTTSGATRAKILRDHIMPILEQQRSAVLGSATPEARAAYQKWQQETGGDTNWMTVPLKPKDTRKLPESAVPRPTSGKKNPRDMTDEELAAAIAAAAAAAGGGRQ